MCSQAEQLLNRFWNMVLPVDVVAIATSWGAMLIPLEHVSDASSIGAAGCALLDRGSGRPLILFRESDHPVRQRFTIAHELGHLVLGHAVKGVMYRDNFLHPPGTDAREISANAFAASLLMPAETLRRYAAEPKFNSVSSLAALFTVSEEAMQWRLINLNILRKR